MGNIKFASHRRKPAKTKSSKHKCENNDLESRKCDNFSLNSLLMVLENINPVFFTFDKKKNHVLRATINYQDSSESNSVSSDTFSKHYFIKIKDNKMILFSDKEFIFENEDVSFFTLKDVAVQVIENIKANFYPEIKWSGYLSERTEKINHLLRAFCRNNNISFKDIEHGYVSLEEIYNKEIKVDFKINNVLIEEYIDLYIKEGRLDMLENVLRNKYSIKEADEIKSSLNETDFEKEMKNKKRI